MSPSFKAVVFDLDDTLYSEREYAFSGFAAVADAFADRLESPCHAEFRMRRLFDTPDRPHVFNTLLAEYGISADKTLVDAMIEVYRMHQPNIRLFEDAEKVLMELRPAYRLGLLTDGRSTTQGLKIDALGIRNRFDAIVVTGEHGPAFSKPGLRAFELIAARLQVSRGRAVYVADNPAKDFVAPNALGWMTVHVRRECGLYFDRAPAPGGLPHHIVDSLVHLPRLLNTSRRC